MNWLLCVLVLQFHLGGAADRGLPAPAGAPSVSGRAQPALASTRLQQVPGPRLRPPADDDEAQLILVHLPTLADHLSTLGGRLVRVQDVRVGRVVSPQAFVIFSGREMFSGRDDARSLVLLDRPARAALTEGIEVEVVGRAYTLAGASVAAGWPQDLTPEAVETFRGVPIIVAHTVLTPGDVELYRRSSLPGGPWADGR